MILHEHRRELEGKGAQENNKEATCSRNTHFSDVFFTSSLGHMERIEREANGQQRDRSKNHHQDRAYPSRFDVEKSDDFD